MPVTLDRLKSQLLTSGLQQENSALFQIINQLVDFLRNEMVATDNLISGGGGGGIGLLAATYLTKNKEGGLPNSLQTLPGAGIQFNDSMGRRIISTAIPFGLDGEQGEIGFDGFPGIQGIQGLTGVIGINGAPGPPGLDGIQEEFEIPLSMIGNEFRGLTNLRSYTVATLPTAIMGDIACVTDALAPAFLTILVGGGVIVTPAFYDGTNWVGF